MLLNSKGIESIGKIFLEFKNYLELQKEFIRLDATEKLTVALSAVVVTTVALLLGFIVLLFAAFGLAYYLGDALQSLALGFGIVSAIVLLVSLIFYFNRSRLVIQPIARFMIRLMIDKGNAKAA